METLLRPRSRTLSTSLMELELDVLAIIQMGAQEVTPQRVFGSRFRWENFEVDVDGFPADIRDALCASEDSVAMKVERVGKQVPEGVYQLAMTSPHFFDSDGKW